MKATRRIAALAIGVLILTIGMWLLVERRCASELHAQLGTSISDFLAARPGARAITRFRIGDAVYFRVVGAGCSDPFKGFRSGPPEYVFDPTGALVDMCLDPDSPSEFYARWNRFPESAMLSDDEVVRLTARPGLEVR